MKAETFWGACSHPAATHFHANHLYTLPLIFPLFWGCFVVSFPYLCLRQAAVDFHATLAASLQNMWWTICAAEPSLASLPSFSAIYSTRWHLFPSLFFFLVPLTHVFVLSFMPVSAHQHQISSTLEKPSHVLPGERSSKSLAFFLVPIWP